MSIFTLYFIFVILPSLAVVITALLVLSLAISIVLFAFAFGTVRNEELAKSSLKKAKYFAGVFAALTLISIFVPSERQLYTIAGAYAITNIGEIDKLPKNLVDAANAYLEKIIENEKNQKN